MGVDGRLAREWRRQRVLMALAAVAMALVGVTLMVGDAQSHPTVLRMVGAWLCVQAAALAVACTLPPTVTRAEPDPHGVRITLAAAPPMRRRGLAAWTAMCGSTALMLLVAPWCTSPRGRVVVAVACAVPALALLVVTVIPWLPGLGDGSIVIGPGGVDQDVRRRHVHVSWQQLAVDAPRHGVMVAGDPAFSGRHAFGSKRQSNRRGLRPDLLGLGGPDMFWGMLASIAADPAEQASLMDRAAPARVGLVLGLPIGRGTDAASGT